MMSPSTYCVDTSALLDGRSRYYPPQIFPALWDKIEVLIAEGRFVIPEEVLAEIIKKDDETAAWVKRHPEIVTPLDRVQEAECKLVLRDFPRLVDTRKGRSIADPFVIALAKARKLVVVTGESIGTIEKPKIPIVCDHYHIEWITFLDIVTREHWSF